MTTQILNLPLVNLTFSTSLDSDWRCSFIVTVPDNLGVQQPIDLSGITYSLRIRRTDSSKELLLKIGSDTGEISIGGTGHNQVSIAVPVSLMGGLPVGTWPMDILAQADSVTWQFAVGSVTQNYIGGSIITGITVTPRVPGSGVSAFAVPAGPQGATGATGAIAWGPVLNWVSSSNYTSVPPASVVTYQGETYVCLTTHTAGSSFDPSKWTKIAAKGVPAWAPTAVWNTSTAYTVGPPASLVSYLGEAYVCIVTHTSTGSFDPAKWTKVSARGPVGDHGGAITLPYTFSALTTDVDPGTGNLRFDNATLSLATSIYLDTSDALTIDRAGLIDQFDASTSTVKGHIRITVVGDPSKWMVANVTGRVMATGYRKLTISNIVASTTNPFTAGDQILLLFTRNGDKGSTGDTGPLPWANPVAFTAGIVASATAPATLVVYQSETYICTTAHTTTSSFDSTKWLKLAAKGDASGGGTVSGDLTFTGAHGLVLANGGKIIDGASSTLIDANGDVLEVYKEDGSSVILRAAFADPAPQFKGQDVYHVGNFDGGHGQCRLIYTSGSTVTLVPWNGNKLVVNGVQRTIPSGGVALSNSGLTQNTRYFVYATWTGSAIALETSATGHATHTNGVEIKSGDPTRTLVGMVRTDATSGTPLFGDNQAYRGVASWYNKRPRSLLMAIANGWSTSSGTYVQLGGSSTTITFLTWGDAVSLGFVLQVDLADDGSDAYTTDATIAVDGGTATGTWGQALGYSTQIGNMFMPLACGGTAELSEGVHTAAPMWAVAGGTALTVPTSILNGTVFI